LIILIHPVAMKLGFTDRPTHRKQHKEPTPLIGGLAVYLAILAASLVYEDMFPHQFAYLSAISILVCVGLFDDYCGLSVRFRLVAQIAAGLIMTEYAELKISYVGVLIALGDLDVHNGRHGVTPEHPEGTYAYFVTLNEQYTPAYPYVLGPTYYGTVQAGNTGPMSGHNIIPPSAILFDPNATTEVTEAAMNTFSLFPVPAVNVLTIRSTGAALLSVDVVDGTGRMVHRASADGPAATLDLSALPAGTYAARIGTVDGHTATRSFLLF
jgi:hypothetical protein